MIRRTGSWRTAIRRIAAVTMGWCCLKDANAFSLREPEFSAGGLGASFVSSSRPHAASRRGDCSAGLSKLSGAPAGRETVGSVPQGHALGHASAIGGGFCGPARGVDAGGGDFAYNPRLRSSMIGWLCGPREGGGRSARRRRCSAREISFADSTRGERTKRCR